MKVALIHDWLVAHAGGEKVLQELLAVYPDADVFTVIDFIPEDQRSWLGGAKVTPTFIQRMPMAKKKYRNYLPLFPVAIEQFDLAEYQLVISSSHAVAKGVITGPDQLHVCYCHSPARYAWDLQHQYLRESGLTKGVMSGVVRYLLHRFRLWDLRSSFGVDAFVANSDFIKRRIDKCYRREATVIYPPVDVERFQLKREKEQFYFTASRMVPYKKIDLIVSAFKALPHLTLKVIGEGPDFNKIKAIADQAPNVELLGFQSNEILVDHMQRAKAFVFAAEEDFGIVPVEAQACGTPVIAYGKGGSLETVVAGKTGLHFGEQTTDSLIEAIEQFEQIAPQFNAEAIRAHAESFSIERFHSEFSAYVNRQLGTRHCFPEIVQDAGTPIGSVPQAIAVDQN